jgi:predicted alpha/beta superfamily hydrolase
MPIDSSIELLLRRRVMSPELRNFRDLVVALPPSYSEGDRRYPVVYMHDGQNLFDPDTSFAGAWGLTETLAALATSGTEAIVVAVPNTGRDRLYEYGPFRDRELGGGGGERYLAFLAGTVKQLVDRSFRTNPVPEQTVVAGSSMGGLISLYALFRHSDTFGAAGAMSPSVWFADQEILAHAVRWAPLALGRRVYLDIGSDEGDEAVAHVRALRDIFLASGFESGVDFDYVEDEGAIHHEAAWGRRAARALPFLLGS